MTNSIADIHLADVLLVTGSNTTEAHPVISLEMKRAARKRGAKLILIDPREIELAGFASLHLRPRSGTDVALLNAMAQVIIADGLAKKDFIQARTENFEALAESVKDCTPQWAEDISGVPSDLIVEAARVYGQAGSAAIFWAMGITQSSHGVDNVQALANLALLTGNFGRPGTGVNPLRGQNNVQGACDMGGLPNVLTGYQAVTDEAVRAKFERAWATPTPIPAKPGLTVTELMSGVLDGRIKALYIMGENPLLSDPNMNHGGSHRGRFPCRPGYLPQRDCPACGCGPPRRQFCRKGRDVHEHRAPRPASPPGACHQGACASRSGHHLRPRAKAQRNGRQRAFWHNPRGNGLELCGRICGLGRDRGPDPLDGGHLVRAARSRRPPVALPGPRSPRDADPPQGEIHPRSWPFHATGLPRTGGEPG
jgi:hypothetical protein